MIKKFESYNKNKNLIYKVEESKITFLELIDLIDSHGKEWVENYLNENFKGLIQIVMAILYVQKYEIKENYSLIFHYDFFVNSIKNNGIIYSKNIEKVRKGSFNLNLRNPDAYNRTDRNIVKLKIIEEREKRTNLFDPYNEEDWDDDF